MQFHGGLQRAAGTATDKSATATGAAQLVIAGNSNRLGYSLFNPVDTGLNVNGASIFVKFLSSVSNLGGSYEVTPGGYFPPPWFPPWNGDVFVFGAAGIKFTAEEYT